MGSNSSSHQALERLTLNRAKEKKEFLKQRFPLLQDRHLCNSRDLSFEKHILNETNGEGVDVILNSLAEEKLKISLNCIARNGRFLEIGKYDFSNNTKMATRGLLATDHVILNHGQVTWTTPELAQSSPNYHTTPTGGRFSS
ncbi:fatty acid synthase [Trichonephila clavipes]|nr:fatty acid synthase [Trichonephila clavipes]